MSTTAAPAMPLCRYRYNALDIITQRIPAAQPAVERFYQKKQLSLEVQEGQQQRLMYQDDIPLAQRQSTPLGTRATLLGSDRNRSVLHGVQQDTTQHAAYGAFGHRPVHSGLESLLGFNGERRDPLTGHYHLGSGYRAFNPYLLRFNAPDSWSPFGKGGLNAYAYCLNDPINRRDPAGHSALDIFNVVAAAISLGTSLFTFKGSRGVPAALKAVERSGLDPESIFRFSGTTLTALSALTNSFRTASILGSGASAGTDFLGYVAGSVSIAAGISNVGAVIAHKMAKVAVKEVAAVSHIASNLPTPSLSRVSTATGTLEEIYVVPRGHDLPGNIQTLSHEELAEQLARLTPEQMDEMYKLAREIRLRTL